MFYEKIIKKIKDIVVFFLFVLFRIRTGHHRIVIQLFPDHLRIVRLFFIQNYRGGQQAEWFLVKQAYFDEEIVPNKTGSNFADRASAEDNEGGYI